MPENQSKDPSEDEAEERHDRWLFNGVVFFLVVPFTIVVLGMSPMALGLGLTLVMWRVAVTPEMMNRLSFSMGTWLRRFLRNLVIGVVTGFILLGVSDYVTGDSFSGAIGFPLSYTHPIPCAYGPLRVACVAIDPQVVVLDYLFWVALSLFTTSLIGWTATRWSFSKPAFQATGNTQMTQ